MTDSYMSDSSSDGGAAGPARPAAEPNTGGYEYHWIHPNEPAPRSRYDASFKLHWRSIDPSSSGRIEWRQPFFLAVNTGFFKFIHVEDQHMVGEEFQIRYKAVNIRICYEVIIRRIGSPLYIRMHFLTNPDDGDQALVSARLG